MNLSKSLAAFCLAAGLGCGASHAAPVTVSAGESVIFNFDFVAAGATPAPPYATMNFFLDKTSYDFATDIGTWSVFDDIEGGGAKSDWTINTTQIGFSGSAPSILDGSFSLRLTMSTGSVVVDPYAVGNLLRSNATGRVNPLAVPEPSSIALVGLAMLGLGALRRSRR